MSDPRSDWEWLALFIETYTRARPGSSLTKHLAALQAAAGSAATSSVDLGAEPALSLVEAVAGLLGDPALWRAAEKTEDRPIRRELLETMPRDELAQAIEIDVRDNVSRSSSRIDDATAFGLAQLGLDGSDFVPDVGSASRPWIVVRPR